MVAGGSGATLKAKEEASTWREADTAAVERLFPTTRHVVVAVMAFLASASQYGFGVFVEPLTQEFGWSRTAINAALSMGLVTNAIASPISGAAVDRFGPRKAVPVSLLLCGVGLLVASFAQTLPVYYAGYITLYCGMSGASTIGAPKTVGVWWPGKRRGRVMGSVTAGNNFMGLIVVQVATAFVAADTALSDGDGDGVQFRPGGWRDAMRAMAAMLATVALLFTLLVSNKPPDVAADDSDARRREMAVGPSSAAIENDVEQAMPAPAPAAAPSLAGDEVVTLRQALRMGRFYLLALACSAAFWTYGGVFSHVMPSLVSEGIDVDEAATAFSIMAIFGIASKLVSGALTEAITARRTFQLIMLVQALACGLFIAAATATDAGSDARRALLWCATLLYGCGFGGVGALLPLTTLEQFGPKSFGTIMGAISTSFVLPSLLGPLIAGAVFDSTASYAGANAIAAGVFVVSMLASQLLPSPDTLRQRAADRAREAAAAADGSGVAAVVNGAAVELVAPTGGKVLG